MVYYAVSFNPKSLIRNEKGLRGDFYLNSVCLCWLFGFVVLCGDKLGCLGLIVDYIFAMAVIGVVI